MTRTDAADTPDDDRRTEQDELATRTRRLVLVRGVRAAAVLGIAVGVGWLVRVSGGGGDAAVRGERSAGGLEALEPVGPVAAIDRFAWAGSPVPGGRYRLSFFADAGGRPGAAILGEPLELAATEWTPDDAWRSAAPAALFWEVTAIDAAGDATGPATLVQTAIR